jgi:hypothetical protein
MKLLITQLSPTSRHFIPVWSKYSPQHPVLPLMSGAKFHTHVKLEHRTPHCSYYSASDRIFVLPRLLMRVALSFRLSMCYNYTYRDFTTWHHFRGLQSHDRTL